MAFNRDKRGDQPEDHLDEHTVFINRCAKTVKGGRRMSFSAVIVVGDKEGKVGLGFGKANEVADAIRTGGEAARKDMRQITMKGKTIPHDVEGTCDGGRVILKPAPDGTGLIVGGGMRPVLEAAGIRDAVATSSRAASRRSWTPSSPVASPSRPRMRRTKPWHSIVTSFRNRKTRSTRSRSFARRKR